MVHAGVGVRGWVVTWAGVTDVLALSRLMWLSVSALVMAGADAVSPGQRERPRSNLVHGLGRAPLRTTGAVSELMALVVLLPVW